MHNKNNKPFRHNNNLNKTSLQPIQTPNGTYSDADSTRSSTRSLKGQYPAADEESEEHSSGGKESDPFNWPSNSERSEKHHSAPPVELLPDQYLATLSWKNLYILFIWITTASCWALAAMPIMVSTFLMEIPCQNQTTIGPFTTPKTGEQCTKPTTCDKLKGTLTEEFGLLTENGNDIRVLTFSIAEFSTTLFLGGIVIGALVFPRISDRIGRQPILCLSLIFSGAIGCLSAAANHVYMFLVLRFLQGGCFPGIGITNWVLAYESIGPKLRSYTAMLFGVCWVIGYCSIGPMAYLLPNWRWLSLASSIPALFFGLIYLFILPESFHWLTSNGQTIQIQAWMDRANNFTGNFGKKQPTTTIRIRHSSLRQKVSDESHSTTTSMPSNVRRVIAVRNWIAYCLPKSVLCFYTTIFAYLWLCNTFIYYGLSLFSTKLVGDLYWNYVFVGLAEIPSYLVSPFLLDRLGRKLFIASAHFIAAFTYFVIAFNDMLPKCPIESVTLAMWLLGKFAISCSFTSLFVYSSEVFPTDSRNTRIGICAAVSRIGATLVPFVSQMSRGSQLSVYGGAAFAAALLTLLLPETKDGDLPESINEVPKTKTLTLTHNPKKRIQLKH